MSVVDRIKARVRSTRTDLRRRRVFKDIFHTGAWGSAETASGTGSTLEQTEVIRRELPILLRELGVRSLVDVPCGDWHWMRHVELPVSSYIGLDVVDEVIARNSEAYGGAGRSFRTHDLTRRVPPRADLVLVRDLLVHLCDADIRRALANVVASGSTWLLTTTFTGQHPNHDIETGSWRPLNLQLPPWSFPEPDRLVNEHCTVEDNRWLDKSLGLWRVATVPV